VNPVLAETIREQGDRELPSYDPRELLYFRAPDSGGHIPAEMAEVDAELPLDAVEVPAPAVESLVDAPGERADLLVLKPDVSERIALTAV
jgi:hypothetical protein